MPEGSLRLVWEMETKEAAERWRDLLLDMIPCAFHLWTDRPGWTPKWSVQLGLARGSSTLRKPVAAVRLVLWCEPDAS